MHHVIVALFYQIPEGIMITLAGLGLLGMKKPRRRLIGIGVLYGSTIPVIRAVGFPSGLHIGLLLLMFMVIVRFTTNTPWLTAGAAWILATFFITVGEQLIMLPLVHYFQVAPQATIANPWAHVMWGWVSASLLFVITMIVCRTDLVLISAPDSSDRQFRGKESRK